MTLDNYINTSCCNLKKILLQTVALFPDVWKQKPDYVQRKYIRIALRHIIEFGEPDPQKIIKMIKRGTDEDWRVDTDRKTPHKLPSMELKKRG